MEIIPPGPRTQRGQGSGIIIDKSGIVLTNSHVVNGATKVTVRLTDKRVLEGKVVGQDELLDLAVVKVDTKGKEVPVAELGDSDQVQPGEWAIAVGNPLGLDNTVTLGIVSSINRSSAEVGLADKRLDFIQTDCAINPGNSGGPLINDRGQVIGVTTAIRANAEGIGFAIPINKAKQIKSVLVRGGKVQHPYIGVQLLTLTPDEARRLNADPNTGMYVPEAEGGLVMKVISDTPAEKGGLRRGDVIIEVEGRSVHTADQIQKIVDQSQIGGTLRITVLRGQGQLTLKLKTADISQSFKAGAGSRP